MRDSKFCEMCPDGALGSWRTGHKAWEVCHTLGRCARVYSGEVEQEAEELRAQAAEAIKADNAVRAATIWHITKSGPVQVRRSDDEG